MASLDSLPADQRAVLQLILQRGRSYDDIAQLLSIDRAAVRERALAAFDALGPQTRVDAERRALITDYLLGQLPPRVSDDTRDRLAESASERAWARVLSSELSPLAAAGLPEIPAEAASAPEPVPAAAAPVDDEEPEAPAPRIPQDYGLPEPEEPEGERRRSRFGGMVLLIGGGVIALIVVIAIIASGGSSNKSSSSTSAATPPTTASTAATGSTPTSTPTTSTAPKVIAQINLTSATTTSKAAGIAEVLRQGANTGIAIVASGMTPNTKHDAYAVWLYNSPTDNHILGFVNPGVATNGRLSTAGALPANASHFKELIVTLETQARPKAPGTIVLQGTLTGV
jgi:sigma-70-like protein